MNKDEKNFVSVGSAVTWVTCVWVPRALGWGHYWEPRILCSGRFSSSVGADWGLENMVIALG